MAIFYELGIIVAVATVVSIFMKLIKQPLIIGYIITGIVIGPHFLNFGQSSGIFELTEIGEALLLFIVGLSLDFKP